MTRGSEIDQGEGPPTVTVFIKMGSTTNAITIHLHAKVERLRAALLARRGLSANLSLSWSGHHLKDNRTLEEYNIQDGATIFTVGGLPGARASQR